MKSFYESIKYMNYQQAWDYLDSLQFHKIKLGLDAMRSFMAMVNNPIEVGQAVSVETPLCDRVK